MEAILFQQNVCKEDNMVNVLVKPQLLFLLEIFTVWDHSLQILKESNFVSGGHLAASWSQHQEIITSAEWLIQVKEICISAIGKGMLSEVSLHLHRVW